MVPIRFALLMCGMLKLSPTLVHGSGHNGHKVFKQQQVNVSTRRFGSYYVQKQLLIGH
jgi:hypothetical protein